jgi:hypothetical protein
MAFGNEPTQILSTEDMNVGGVLSAEDFRAVLVECRQAAATSVRAMSPTTPAASPLDSRPTLVDRSPLPC